TAAELRRVAGEAEGPGSAGTAVASDADRRFEEVLDATEAAFHEAMDDDLNTALALGRLFELAREVNRYLAESEGVADQGARRPLLGRAYRLLLRLGGVLGFRLDEPLRDADPGTERLGPVVDLLLELRQAARDERRYDLADRIRDHLGELGIHVEDTREGVRWSLAGRDR